MAFPAAFIDELIARNPIEDVVGQYVTLRRSGANMFGLCPFHGEKTASFSVAPDKGIYYCFGCHKGGGPINFMMELEGLSYPDAVRNLAQRAGMEVPEDEQYQSRYRQQERLWALMKESARYFHSQLYSPAGAEGLAYAQKRGLPKNIITKFGLGFAPDSWNGLTDTLRAKGYTDREMQDAGMVSEKNGRIFDRFRNRLMFPIIDVRGNIIGFGGRVMDDSTPKYLNSPETIIFNKRKNLFALNIAKKSKLGYLILVEGYMDAIALHQYGFDCAVASLGTSLTEEHATLISRYVEQVVLIYDGDEAGQRATRRAIPMLEKAGINVKVLQMKEAKDPDEFLKKFGADRFKLLLQESSNRVDYQLEAIAKKYDIRDPEQKLSYVKESSDLICTLDSAVKREVYGTRVAERAGLSYDALKLEINKAFKRRIAWEKKKQESIDLAPAANLQPKSRDLRYDNIKSAVAEEGIIANALKDPSLFDQSRGLNGADFSVEFFGRVFMQLYNRYQAGMEVSLAVLGDFSAEEMNHLTGVCQRHDGPANEVAFADCVNTVLAQRQSKDITTDDDLLAFRNRLREQKGARP